jgi:hypothetical protein
MWYQSQYISKQQATAPQILQLLSIVDRELADAEIVAVSADGRFTHAYNAALTLCRIALLAAGYRVAKGGGAHYREINSIVYTVGESQKNIQIFLSACTKKRGQEVYTHAGVVDPQDVDDLVETAKQLREDVLFWIKADHPHLFPSP